ncbi:hypothetical protein BDV98DRAFT_559880 [Pterulicium gracile]|uniref:Uncharacterized protein n=1 Tax=Pterulicium gracile TaxID=1884261 RepID=A0A5C3R6A6_9AGAR|nr:hypothetical protein BDV98DRAFT_559880 [Pterula gracilis]
MFSKSSLAVLLLAALAVNASVIARQEEGAEETSVSVEGTDSVIPTNSDGVPVESGVPEDGAPEESTEGEEGAPEETAEDGDEEPSPSDEETPETPEESEAAEEDAEGAARPLALSFAGIAGVLGSAVVGAAIAL